MKGVDNALLTDKSRRPKSREVSSRFLSPKSAPSSDMGIPSPNQAFSPRRSVKSSMPPDDRKHRSLDQGLWPSSTTTISQSSDKKIGTLAEHFGNERLRDFLDRKADEKSSCSSVFLLGRQRSCSEFSRFQNEKEKEKGSAKENHRPILGGSMRYTGKFKFPGKSSSSSSSSNSSSDNSGIARNFFESLNWKNEKRKYSCSHVRFAFNKNSGTVSQS